MRMIILLVSMIALTACGAVYRSSSVSPGLQNGTQVRVVPLSAETVVQANRSTYTPKTLPAVFSLTAGTGGGVRSVGTLPQPTFDAQLKPETLDVRLPPSTRPGPYRIGVGDVLVLTTPDTGVLLSESSVPSGLRNGRQAYTVQDDGAINIPSVGRVKLADLTIESAEAELFQKMVTNQQDPTFSLEIAEFNSRRVSVGGAVAAPAVVPVTLTPLSLDAALAATGGVAVQDQDSASVRLYRDGSLYQIPLSVLYARPDLLKTRLLDGDSVFVDTEYELGKAQAFFEQQIALVAARQQAQQAALLELQTEVSLRRAQLTEARSNYQAQVALGADKNDYVYLTGEFREQGRFALPFERRAVLADALLAQTRGFSVQSADISQVYVLRASSDPREFGAVTAWHLDARNAASFTLMTRFELRPNDVIFVAQQPITKWNRAVSQILPSLINVSRVAVE
ncbi:polysaccharide biosynthesis/export family protein [Roseovarius rhodophyticola]|uniref:Polysaccharide biosynthesis/export family protein n=1 Tax=Roseovarius rhodophyticola TaxID=3080827 RepID=A0ABZ2TQ13_9RHOB|nr:polysaccharide biosynthesis/export family protein [Roseovarius sp. W115]MDV2930223.1 polysaccharide biosynthesis/export family protein [Roseovarius sp. W115]